MVNNSLAELAYNAYCQSSGGVSLISGAKLPPFAELSLEIKKAWNAAACAVADYVLDPNA